MSGSPLILVVDDEPSVRRVIRTFLERDGRLVLEAANAADALALYTSNEPNVRLVVTDVRMKIMDGNELARRIHELIPSQTILFVTAYPGDVDQSVTRFETIAKPFTGKVLLAKVSKMMQLSARSSGA